VPRPIGEQFAAFRKLVSAAAPSGFIVRSERYPDEDHGSTTLLAHYAGLRSVFDGWKMLPDPNTGLFPGGLKGIEDHYRQLSQRFGFPVSAEQPINQLGYALLAQKKVDDALAAFRRNVELYPNSANVYDSLADGLEAAGQNAQAKQTVEKALAVAGQTGDPLLPQFKQHLDRLIAAESAASAKAATGK
jgi:tetratricopeptide (TPR) repeat protein